FGKPLAGLLISGIAIIDSTAQGARPAGRAEVVFLKGAEIGRYGPLVRWSVGQQDFRLQIAEEEDVAIFLETATTAAGHAHGTRGGDRLVNFVIQLQHLATQFF